MTHLLAKEAVRTVGVHVCPQSQWDSQFKDMKDETIEPIAKLNTIDIKHYLICLYFKTRLLKKVFFVCGVIKLIDHQDKALRKLHETNIDKKLRLGCNFPRAKCYWGKNSVGMYSIKQKIVVVILAYKLYIGNTRAHMKISKIVKIQEESVTIEHRRECKGRETKTKKPTPCSE